MRDQLLRRFYRVDLDSLDHRGFVSVVLRHEQAADAAFPRLHRHGKDAAYTAHLPVQRDLAEKSRIAEVARKLAGCAEDGYQQRKIIHRALLADVCRGKVYGDPPQGEVEAAVF